MIGPIPGNINSACLVCKSWKLGIPGGVQTLELDMNPSQEAWQAKVEQLRELTPSVSSCKAHVSKAVPKLEFGGKIKHLAHKLRNIQVGCLQENDNMAVALRRR